jgi:FKBP-type peptidyl-prolyl cis-trans isomerase
VSKFPAIAAVLGVALALSACSAADPEKEADSANTSAVTAECTDPGATSNAVDVGGEFGVAPTVTFDAPVKVDATERTVALKGDGKEKAEAGSIVDVAFTVYHGGTGEEITSTGYGAEAEQAQFPVDEAQIIEGIVRALNCSVEGDRIVVAIPPAELFGELGNEQMGISPEDAAVFVFDVLAVAEEPEPVDAAGDLVEVDADAEGMPTVAHAENGAPIVTIPQSEPLSELTLAVLKDGTGDVVAEGDSVEVNYMGINWTSGAEFDSSWSRGEPAEFPTTGVIPGFGAALVGQPIGSEVVVVIPPAYGYGSSGQPAAGIAGTDTLVFVVEILGITK